MAEESRRELAAILRDAIEPQQRMKRPIAVTVLGGLFIVAGTVGLVYPLRERPLEPQIVSVSVIPVRRFVRFFHRDFRELRSAADRKGFVIWGPVVAQDRPHSGAHPENRKKIAEDRASLAQAF